MNWYNRVFGWLPFVDSANDIRRENRRLPQNQHALAAGIERYRTRQGQEAA